MDYQADGWIQNSQACTLIKGRSEDLQKCRLKTQTSLPIDYCEEFLRRRCNCLGPRISGHKLDILNSACFEDLLREPRSKMSGHLRLYQDIMKI